MASQSTLHPCLVRSDSPIQATTTHSPQRRPSAYEFATSTFAARIVLSQMHLPQLGRKSSELLSFFGSRDNIDQGFWETEEKILPNAPLQREI